jgi:hypothetical protein
LEASVLETWRRCVGPSRGGFAWDDAGDGLEETLLASKRVARGANSANRRHPNGTMAVSWLLSDFWQSMMFIATYLK